MSNKERFQPESIEDVEADDELFGEVIEQSDAHIEDVNVMSRSDLSEASSPTRGSSIQLPNRNSKHAGVEDMDRPVAAAPLRASSASGIGLTIALAVFVIAAIALLTMGSPDPQPGDDPAKQAAVEVEPAKAVPDAVPQIEPEPDDGQGDGTPTLDAETVMKGMVAAGWRVGDPSVAAIKGVTQTNVLATRDDKIAASVTIYESQTWDWTKQLVVETEPPSKAVSFGRTVARVSLGPDTKQNGVLEMVDALNALKKAARAKAQNESPELADPPEEGDSPE